MISDEMIVGFPFGPVDLRTRRMRLDVSRRSPKAGRDNGSSGRKRISRKGDSSLKALVTAYAWGE